MDVRELPPGVWAVALTPFTPKGTIDWAGYDMLLDHYVDNGLNGVFAACASSEASTLSEDECIALTERAVRRVGQRLGVVGGLSGGCDLRILSASVRRMADAGASAVVLSPATLARADEDDRQLRVRIDEVLAATDSIPLGLYECPLPYHRLIPAPLFGELARSGRFLFHKDTTCDADAIEAKLTVSANTPVNIYNANMQSLPASLVAGAAGYCGVATNVYPDLVVRFCQQVARGENDGRLHALLVQAEEVFGRTYPRSAKRLLAMQGLPIGTHCRCDVPEITPVVEVRLRALLDEVAQHRETSRDIARVPATS